MTDDTRPANHPPQTQETAGPHDLGAASVALVRSWLEASADAPPDPTARRRAPQQKDPHRQELTGGFNARVGRTEDSPVAPRPVRRLARRVPAFLPWYQKALLVVGAVVSFVLPGVVVGLARWTLRRIVGHLVVDARPEPLGKAITRLRAGGDRLNLNLLGEAVLGEQEARRRLDGTREMLERPDVDYVSIKVSAVASNLSMWAFDQTVERVVERLRPLYETASQGEPTFINLDMEEYRDLDLTLAVFTTILDEFPHLEAGVVLQAYLPDSLAAMQRLQAWAAERRAAGGAPIKVRVVKGANLAMETVDATVHGWPLATWGSKRETDTSYKRVLRWAMTPERVDAVRLGVAGQNLFDVAHAWLLAGERGVRDAVEIEMLLGMATGPTAAVRRDVGHLLLYTPVVRPEEFDVAISYLVRRLEENASPENFMSAVFDLRESEELFARERDRFLASLAALDAEPADHVPSPHRVQDRRHEQPVFGPGFENTPDTDPSVAANRAWAAGILDRAASCDLGTQTVAAHTVTERDALEDVLVRSRQGGVLWGARPAAERAAVLRAAAASLASRRGDLVAVMASETGKTIAEADVEVSEAVDFARYYADQALRLDAVDGATFSAAILTLVTPPWNFPVAIPAGSVLAALAAGSAVAIKPAPQSRRCAAVMVEALWDAGVPQDALAFLEVGEAELGRDLVAHHLVDRVVLTGAWETARLFRSWRPDLPLLAETSGKNAVVVTPSADLDLAVADLVRSAFGHAGQKCSAASLGILVGSVATSERFRRQLVDSVTSLPVGWPTDPTSVMGPVVEPPRDKLRQGLTELGDGEEWLVEPRPLDDTGRLWSPGVRIGVRPGSAFHRTEYFGPVLGLMAARDLDEAIAWQNATDYGLTAGLHSLDAREVERWADRVEAGNLYVNRGITGAVVRRQPFGGWKRSTVGATSKAGGPSYLFHLGSWSPAPLRLDPDPVTLAEPVEALLAVAVDGLDGADAAWLRGAAASDQHAWAAELGGHRDVSALGVERNVLRHLPVPVTVRLGEEGTTVQLARVLLAARRAGAPVRVSSAVEVPAALHPDVHVEDHAAWLRRVADERPERVRLVGSSAHDLAVAVDGDPDVAVYADPVTPAGRVELLPFLREQAISITAHRFGNPDPAMAQVLAEPPRTV